jgi:hypothetical protein
MKSSIFFNRIFVAASAAMLIFSSCQKEDQNDIQPNDSAEAGTVQVAEATASTEAIFIVNTTPEGATRDSIVATDLPLAISSYLDANYSGYTFKKTFKVTANGAVDSYIVVINYNGKPVGLKFDANGTFVKVFEQREHSCLRGKGWKRGGRFDGRDGQHRDTIALADLSTTIKAYFGLTYPSDTLLSAFKGKDNSIVVISTNNALYATVFNGSDLFVKRAQIIANKGRKTAVAEANLLANITSYLVTTYPGYVFNRAYAININNTTQAYIVVIDANGTRYGLQFNASGNFVSSIAIR